jgi:2-polyprenyl-3-methyl-5-hydroxy-6-metoxy-1,4-benzoquinol methylase
MDAKKKSVCPVWLGYVFLIPIRKFQHNPVKILGKHVKKGMDVMDYGCAMGYFSLPMARLVGDNGNVYCVDIQEKMLEKLQTRANKAGLGQIVKPRLVGKTYIVAELQNKIDFVLLFMVAHEVPDQKKLFTELFSQLKPGGKVLFAEPKGHVSPEEFEKSIQLAISAGFKVAGEKPLSKGLSAFLLK